MTLAIVIGTIVAIMRLSPSFILNTFASAYIWLFRGAPALIQLIFWFNLSIVVREISVSLPLIGTLFSIKTNEFMTPFVSAVVALSLHEAGYMAEIVRAGINSVGKGQTEAAGSLGMSRRLTLWRIILPQAMRFIVPPTGNETINLLKTTSLVTFIAVNDLLYSAQAIYARTFETIPLLLVVMFWYLFVVTVLSTGQYFIERYYGRSELDKSRSLVRIIADAFRLRHKDSPS
jgi:polar amino acid transport system permease protein